MAPNHLDVHLEGDPAVQQAGGHPVGALPVGGVARTQQQSGAQPMDGRRLAPRQRSVGWTGRRMGSDMRSARGGRGLN